MIGKKIMSCLLVAGVALCLTACEKAMPEVSKDVFAMDTFMNVRVYGENAQETAERCVKEIERLDGLFDAQDPGSEIGRLNSEKNIQISADTFDIICRSGEVSELTEGAFDITVYPVVKLWGFTTGENRVPAEDEIDDALQFVDQSFVEIKGDAADRTASLPDNVEIGLGGIAKGYTSDRLIEIFREEGVMSGIVSLGGNVAAYGTKPGGKPWRVAIENPDVDSKISALKNADYLGVVEVSDKSVITSGGYERFFEDDGVRYHHIIDPSTGYPADSGLISVSIISEDGCLADGLSTALFVMGKDRALSLWSEHRDMFDCILVDDDGAVTITDGISDCFSSGLKYEIYR